jgi:branched-chain amino acid transport system substrate-binding protein
MKDFRKRRKTMNKKVIGWTIAVIVVAVVTVGIVLKKGKPTTQSGQPITIGAILPLTGNAAVLGDFVKQGVDVALAEIAETTATDALSMRVVYGDSKNEAAEGINAYRKIKDTDGADIFLVAMSSVSNALAPLAEQNHTVLLATTVSSASFPAQSSWVFRLFITADIDAALAAHFAHDDLQAKTAAILHVEDDFGKNFASVFEKTFTAKGGKVGFKEGFPKTATDYKDLAAKVKQGQADVLYLLGYDKNLGILIKQLREGGVTTPILSIATVSQPYVIEQAGSAAEGVYFTTTLFDPENPKNDAAKTFVARAEALTGKKPNYFAAFAYDSVRALYRAISRASNPHDPNAIREAFATLPPFEGTVGPIQFDGNGDARFTMIVKQIKNSKVTSPK